MTENLSWERVQVHYKSNEVKKLTSTGVVHPLSSTIVYYSWKCKYLFFLFTHKVKKYLIKHQWLFTNVEKTSTAVSDIISCSGASKPPPSQM